MRSGCCQISTPAATASDGSHPNLNLVVGALAGALLPALLTLYYKLRDFSTL